MLGIFRFRDVTGDIPGDAHRVARVQHQGMSLSAIAAHLLHTSVTIHAQGPVEPGPAWLRYAEPRRWSEWSPQLRRVEYDGGRRLVAGAGGRVFGPLGLSADFSVLDVDEEARRWSWRVRRGPLELRLDHGVEAIGASPGSRTWLVLNGPTALVLGYAPIAWPALHRLVTLEPGPGREAGSDEDVERQP